MHWRRPLRRPAACPICGAPFSSCTTYHTAAGTLAVPVTTPRLLREQLAQTTPAARAPEAISTTFTTGTYERAKHGLRALARRQRQSEKPKLP